MSNDDIVAFRFKPLPDDASVEQRIEYYLRSGEARKRLLDHVESLIGSDPDRGHGWPGCMHRPTVDGIPFTKEVMAEALVETDDEIDETSVRRRSRRHLCEALKTNRDFQNMLFSNKYWDRRSQSVLGGLKSLVQKIPPAKRNNPEIGRILSDAGAEPVRQSELGGSDGDNDDLITIYDSADRDDADAEEDVEADGESDADGEADAEAETKVEADVKSDADAEAETKVEADAEADAEEDAEAETKVEADAEEDAEADAEAETSDGDIDEVGIDGVAMDADTDGGGGGGEATDADVATVTDTDRKVDIDERGEGNGDDDTGGGDDATTAEQLRREISQTRERAESLLTQLSEAQADNQRLATERQECERGKAHLSVQVQELEEQLDVARQEREEAQTVLDQGAIEDAEVLLERVNAAEERAKALESRIEDLNKELVNVEGREVDLQAQNEECERDQRRLQTSVDTLQTRVDELTVRAETCERQLQTTGLQEDEVRKMNILLEQQRTEAAAALDAVKAERDGARMERDEAVERIDALVRERDEAIAARDEARTLLATANNECDEAQASVVTLTKERNDARALVQMLTQERDNARGERDEAQDEAQRRVQTLERERDAARAEVAEATRRQEEVTLLLRAREAEKQVALAEATECTTELRRTNDRCADTQADLERLQREKADRDREDELRQRAWDEMRQEDTERLVQLLINTGITADEERRTRFLSQLPAETRAEIEPRLLEARVQRERPRARERPESTISRLEFELAQATTEKESAQAGVERLRRDLEEADTATNACRSELESLRERGYTDKHRINTLDRDLKSLTKERNRLQARFDESELEVARQEQRATGLEHVADVLRVDIERCQRDNAESVLVHEAALRERENELHAFAQKYAALKREVEETPRTDVAAVDRLRKELETVAEERIAFRRKVRQLEQSYQDALDQKDAGVAERERYKKRWREAQQKVAQVELTLKGQQREAGATLQDLLSRETRYEAKRRDLDQRARAIREEARGIQQALNEAQEMNAVLQRQLEGRIAESGRYLKGNERTREELAECKDRNATYTQWVQNVKQWIDAQETNPLLESLPPVPLGLGDSSGQQKDY